MSRMSTPMRNSQTKTLQPDSRAESKVVNTRILGIDPGSRITGYGLVELTGTTLKYVSSGCIRLPSVELAQRLHQIQTDIEEIISRHQPDIVAIEQVFVHRNASSALKLGQARGAAICAARGLDISEYTPAEVKQVVTGHGRAAKQQVLHMVQALLGLEGEIAEDAADALAIAITHARFATQPELLVKWGKRRKSHKRPASIHQVRNGGK